MNTALFVLLSVIFLSYSNGANDNFKGVATLFGSRTVDFKSAIHWATITTLAGSIASIYISNGLINSFSGKGLIGPGVISTSSFAIAIGVGAAFTVITATLIGIPISTTHSLTGALIGAGVASAADVNISKLGESFFLPLAVSPFLSMILTAAIYPLFSQVRQYLSIDKESCICMGEDNFESTYIGGGSSAVLKTSGKQIIFDKKVYCKERCNGKLIGIDAQSILDKFHYLSSGMVSFARGLNDTPKIVALLVSARAAGIDIRLSMLIVGISMAIGGLLNARKVASTMGNNIVTMNHSQGFTANLVTAILVTVASIFGIPVSTTHVSCGSIFGLGAFTKTARWKVIRNIIFAWIITLPVACLISALIYLIICFVNN